MKKGTMRRLALAAVLVVALGGQAMAETVTAIDGSDRQLHVKLVTSYEASSGVSWGKQGGAGYSSAGEKTHMVVYRGNIPITDDRFVQLLEMEGVADSLTKQYRERGSFGRYVLAGSALALLGGFGLRAVGGPASDPVAGTLAVGGLFGVVGSGTWLWATMLQRPFTAEEAVDAAEAYNRKTAKP